MRKMSVLLAATAVVAVGTGAALAVAQQKASAAQVVVYKSPT